MRQQILVKMVGFEDGNPSEYTIGVFFQLGGGTLTALVFNKPQHDHVKP